MKTKCPKCKSDDIELVDIFDNEFIICNKCGYDESEDVDVVGDSGGKGKSRNVYRKGGGGRSR
jgi:predicted Zn-ribbon and HTH transcriptional regulator